MRYLSAAYGIKAQGNREDKVLTEWNGLMLIAFVESARILDNEHYLKIAQKNANFLLTALRPNNQLRRAWRKGKVGSEVFLADYAALILGLLELYQTDFNNRWFVAAKELADEMIAKFCDPEGGFFDTTNEAVEASSMPSRPKDLQDNAIPSGNSLATEALLKLDAFIGNSDYRKKAEEALELVNDFVTMYPTAFAQWLSGTDISVHNTK